MTARPYSAAAPKGSSKIAASTLSYLNLYRATPVERIAMIKTGVRATVAKKLFADLAFGQGAALQALNMSPATVNRKAAEGKNLSPDESERVLGVAKLVGQLEAMVEESGDPAGFDATAWLSRWLQEPAPALDGARPLDLMDTMEGQALVANTLAKAQSGAYA